MTITGDELVTINQLKILIESLDLGGGDLRPLLCFVMLME